MTKPLSVNRVTHFDCGCKKVEGCTCHCQRCGSPNPSEGGTCDCWKGALSPQERERLQMVLLNDYFERTRRKAG